MRRIFVSRTAAADLGRLRAWLEALEISSDGAGDRLADAVASLARFPDRGRPGPRPDLRELVVPFGKGAYLIAYRVFADRVIVARIRHSREQPPR